MDSWVRLAYTIEKSQPINLMLYQMDPSYPIQQEYVDGQDRGYATLEYYYDPEASDHGASVPEEFFGEFVGYINGVHITDNVMDPDENALKVEPQVITNDEWKQIILESYSGLHEKRPIIGEYSYSFQGEKMVLDTAAAVASSITRIGGNSFFGGQ